MKTFALVNLCIVYGEVLFSDRKRVFGFRDEEIRKHLVDESFHSFEVRIMAK